MQNISTKMKIVIVAISIIIVATIGIYIFKQTQENEKNYYETEENMETKEKNINQITIHITGEVNNPGIVMLDEGARIVDALEAAGGETQNADINKLNLAYVLEDGEKLYIPGKNEEGKEYITRGNGNQTETAKVNINTAQIEELSTLPGIGEATANKIIEYRKENGKFEKIEDIKNVAGIGDSKFQNIKEMLKVK